MDLPVLRCQALFCCGHVGGHTVSHSATCAHVLTDKHGYKHMVLEYFQTVTDSQCFKGVLALGETGRERGKAIWQTPADT